METRIKKVMARVLNIDPSIINNDTAPGNVDGWDSLDQINLIAALEDEFNIEFGDNEYEEMTSYRLIVAIVGTYLDE